MANTDFQNGYILGTLNRGLVEGGGSLLDYTVTFVSEGSPYQIVSVNNGEAIAEIQKPMSQQGLSFKGWKDNLGNYITFPYVPTQDITLNAHFVNTSVYTVQIDTTNSDPDFACTYSDDALSMTPGSNEWDEFFGIYPCLLQNGVEVARLNPNDFSKDIDGNDVDITSGNSGDVMICFPRLDLKISRNENVISISLTDEVDATGYVHYAHKKGSSDVDKFYIAAYEGYLSDGKLRSISGVVGSYERLIDFRSAASQLGSNYYVMSFYQITYIQALFILKYKNINSQNAVGMGYVNKSSYGPTGTLNTSGMNWGNKTTGYDNVKLFGIEDLWGNHYNWIDGAYVYYADGHLYTTTSNYSNEDLYNDVGVTYSTSNYNGTVSDVMGTSESGLFPCKFTGTDMTKYFGDQVAQNSGYGNKRFIIQGSRYNEGNTAGLFCNYVAYGSSASKETFMNARLMYLG